MLRIPLMLLLACAAGSAQGRTPVTPEQAADEVMAAVRAADQSALKALAGRTRPDPWLVADELCARGEHAAAEAFANAAPRKDVEKLGSYVAAQRSRVRDARERRALEAAIDALRGKDAGAALAALAAVDADTPDVLSVRIRCARGAALRLDGRPKECQEVFRDAAGLAEGLGWLERAVSVLHDAGTSARKASDWDGAQAAWEHCLDLQTTRGNPRGVAWALGNLSLVQRCRGRYAEALDLSERALKIQEEVGDRAAVASTLENLGFLHHRIDRPADALRCYERALQLMEQLGDRPAAARTLDRIGTVQEALGDPAAALASYGRELELSQQLGDREATARSLSRIGLVQQDLGNYERALECQERALEIEEELGDRAAVAGALVNMGITHDLRGDYGKALECHRRGLEIAEAIGHRKWAANALANLSVVFYGLGDNGRALEYQRRSLELEEALGDRAGIARSLITIGGIHASLGEHAAALSHYQRALELEEEFGNRHDVAGLLISIGISHDTLGEPGKALDAYRRARSLTEELGDRAGIAAMCVNLGNVHMRHGNYAEALELFEKGLAEAQAVGHRQFAANALGSIGTVHQHRGDYANALVYHGRALGILEELKDQAGIATALASIGAIHSRVGDYERALDCEERALQLSRQRGDRLSIAGALQSIGNTHHRLGNLASALDYYEQALKLEGELGSRPALMGTLACIAVFHQDLGDYDRALDCQARLLEIAEEQEARPLVALTLGNIGLIHEGLGDYAKALDCQQRSLELNRQLGDRPGEARALQNIAEIRREQGDYAKALDYQQQSLTLKEELGERTGVAAGLAAIGLIHEQLGDRAKARDCQERALALASELNALDVEVGALWTLAVLDLREARAADAARRARQAVEKLPLLVGRLGEEHGPRARERWAGLFETGVAAGLAFGDPSTVFFFLESGRAGVLLESLGGREVLAGVAVPDELRRHETEAQAALLKARAEHQRATKGGNREQVRASHAALREAEANVLDVFSRIQRAASAMADVGYPKPAPLDEIRAVLGPTDALVLYALLHEDALALVVTRTEERIVTLGGTVEIADAARGLALGDPNAEPSAAIRTLRERVIDPLGLDPRTSRLLVSPARELAYVPFGLLAEGRAVVHVPSATTYRVLVEEARKHGSGEGVLALGDPDYGSKPDPRQLTLMRAGTALVPLPGTREEARVIGDVALLGREATESGLAEALALRPRWRAVHLACHGLIDMEQPQLSSLALTRDTGSDGFLTTIEVFRMKIPANLVVLSACETARGKVYRAEGVTGFVRAFMCAGAPRVIVSLWKVDDQATQALMVKFYELWRSGEGTATALRRAQEFVRSHEKWRHPSYWAAWQLWGLPD